MNRVLRFAVALPLCLSCVLAVLDRVAAGTAPAADGAPASVPPPGIAEAVAKVQAGDAAGAVAIMREVTAREPGNARAWRTLGYASLRAKDAAAGIAAYKRSLEIEPQFPPALYNLGVGYALAGDGDSAFEWLEKAAATRKLDMTAVETDADLATLRDDPR